VKVASTCKIYANMWVRSPHSGIACNGHWFPNVVFLGGAGIISTRPSCLDRMCVFRNYSVTPTKHFYLLSFPFSSLYSHWFSPLALSKIPKWTTNCFLVKIWFSFFSILIFLVFFFNFKIKNCFGIKIHDFLICFL